MTITTRKFINAILPSEGLYCAFVLPARRHEWFNSKDELADRILSLDILGHHEVRNCYHGNAAYSRQSSKAEDVRALRCLWLDVDAGPTKKYATAYDAAKSLGEFCRTVKLPRPIVVSSGTGLHVYWTFEEEIFPEQWMSLASGLKILCAKHHFHAGAERTCDMATRFRTPGTHNRKTETELPVYCSELHGPYPLNAFEILKSVNEFGRHLSVNKPVDQNSLCAAAQVKPEYAPSDGKQVADLCAQLRHMRDTKGLLSEPEWKACINALAFVDGGRELAHAWSVGDERYDEAETDDKFTRGKELSGPTTCEYFAALNSRCKQCPYQGKVISPVDLGRGAPRSAPAQIEAAIKFAAKIEPELKPVGNFDYVSGSLVYRTENKKGDAINIIVCQYPLYIAAVSRGEKKTDAYGIVFRHQPPHDGWRDIEIPLRVFFGAAGMAEIAGRGIVIHDAELFKKFVRESIDLLQAEGETSVQFEQCGWKEDDTAFLVGKRLYRKDRVEEVPVSPEISFRGREIGPLRGDLATWKAAANKLFGVGVEPQGFTLLCGFAAPLMRFLDGGQEGEGGAILSLVSGIGGQGKSTAMTGASSIWGSKRSLEIKNLDTKNSKGITMGVLSNLPVFADELDSRDPDATAAFVSSFTTGMDKQRATADGLLQQRANAWQTILIGGSNLSLIDALRAARGGEAMSNRIIEFRAELPASILHAKGDQLKNTLAANAGHAGHIYMQQLIQPLTLKYVKAALPKLREELTVKYNFQTQHRFWVRTLAAVSVASVIVKHLELLDFNPDRIMNWVTDHLVERSKILCGSLYEGSHMLARFLNEHRLDTLVMPDSWKINRLCVPIREPARNLVIRYEEKPGRLFIDERVLKKWMHKEGVNWTDLLTELRNKDLLFGTKLSTLSAGTNLPGGQVRCVEINAKHPLLSGMLTNAENISQSNDAGNVHELAS